MYTVFPCISDWRWQLSPMASLVSWQDSWVAKGSGWWCRNKMCFDGDGSSGAMLVLGGVPSPIFLTWKAQICSSASTSGTRPFHSGIRWSAPYSNHSRWSEFALLALEVGSRYLKMLGISYRKVTQHQHQATKKNKPIDVISLTTQLPTKKTRTGESSWVDHRWWNNSKQAFSTKGKSIIMMTLIRKDEAFPYSHVRLRDFPLLKVDLLGLEN